VLLFVLGLVLGSLGGILLMAILSSGKRQQEIREEAY